MLENALGWCEQDGVGEDGEIFASCSVVKLLD
jgi:hypothetical protein